MSDVSVPVPVYQAYNPATDEAPEGEATDCSGISEDDDSEDDDSEEGQP